MCHIDTLFSLFLLSSLTWNENYILLTERKQSSGACLYVSSLFIQWVSPQCKIPSSTPCLLPRYVFDLVLAWLATAIITRKCVVWHVCSVYSAETQSLRVELFAESVLFIYFFYTLYKPKIDKHYSLKRVTERLANQNAIKRHWETEREIEGEGGVIFIRMWRLLCVRGSQCGLTCWSAAPC